MRQKKGAGLAAAVFMAMVGGGTPGCATISETVRHDDRQVRTYERPTVGTDWVFTASAQAERTGEAAVRVVVAVRRHKTCTTESHQVVDRTEITERGWDPSKPNSRTTLYFWGAVGLAAAAGGAFLVATPDSVSADKRESRQLVGWSLVGLGGVAALAPIVNELRTGDSARRVGEVDRVSKTEHRECFDLPAGDVEVVLEGQEGELKRGRTDPTGEFTTVVATEHVLRLGPTYAVRVEGRELGSTTALAQVYAEERRLLQGRRILATIEQETQTGRCTDGRANALGAALQSVRQVFESPQSDYGSDFFGVVDHKLLVATPAGEPLSFTPLVGGEMHILALGFDRSLELEVSDDDGYRVSNRSGHDERIRE